MIRRSLIALAAIAAIVLPFSVLAQQAATSAEVPRAIRRDVPMTNTIRRAFAAGTRDNTGRPGPNYWQLQTDYTINVRVDPSTQTLTGTETIGLTNNSPDALRQINLRLDHNIFRNRVPFASSWVPGEITDGMVITKLVVNGDARIPLRRLEEVVAETLDHSVSTTRTGRQFYAPANLERGL